MTGFRTWKFHLCRSVFDKFQKKTEIHHSHTTITYSVTVLMQLAAILQALWLCVAAFQLFCQIYVICSIIYAFFYSVNKESQNFALCILLFRHVCPATGFCRFCAFQIGKICCQNCIIWNFQSRKFPPVNSYFASRFNVPAYSPPESHTHASNPE